MRNGASGTPICRHRSAPRRSGPPARTAIGSRRSPRSSGSSRRADEDGDPVSHRVEWPDLQAHASFPADPATRVREEVDTSLGLLDCLRYEVRRGDERLTFWFALEHPGMPILMAVANDGDLVSMTTVMSIADD